MFDMFEWMIIGATPMILAGCFGGKSETSAAGYRAIRIDDSSTTTPARHNHYVRMAHATLTISSTPDAAP